MHRSPALTLLLALAASASFAHADTIRRTDGKVLEDVTIVEESLKEVSYRDNNQTRIVPSDEVLEIEYRRRPRLVDEAQSALAENQLADAEALFDDYVDGHLGGNEETRYKWAPAYAAWRVVDLRMMMGNLPGVVAGADRFLTSFPASRFVPHAYMTKANAQAWQGKAAEAKKTLEAFTKVVADQQLSKRWQLESRLALVSTDPELGAATRRDRLDKIQEEAGTTYPTVRNRALVAEGESYLEEILNVQDPEKRKQAVEKARVIFEEILADFKGEAETLAGAFTGLGECIFHEAVAKDSNPELLGEARHNFLRVRILYPEQSRYVPKALFFAGRSFQLLGRKTNDADALERGEQMYREVINTFPDSPWAEQAKRFR